MLYNCQLQLNKWVLSLCLKDPSDCRFLMSDGNWFHAAGAYTAKDRHPKFVDVETTMRPPRVDDRSPLLTLTKDTGWQKSVGYCGARPCSATHFHHCSIRHCIHYALKSVTRCRGIKCVDTFTCVHVKLLNTVCLNKHVLVSLEATHFCWH